MSTHYGYKCRTCKEFSDTWYNRGQDILREVWKFRRHISVLLKKSQTIRVTCGHGEDHAPCWWVIKHLDCDVCLYNEYGDEEEI